jgi:hypothetical protein
MQEMFSMGILVLGTHNTNLRHFGASNKAIVNAYAATLDQLKVAIGIGDLGERLHVKPL